MDSILPSVISWAAFPPPHARRQATHRRQTGTCTAPSECRYEQEEHAHRPRGTPATRHLPHDTPCIRQDSRCHASNDADCTRQEHRHTPQDDCQSNQQRSQTGTPENASTAPSPHKTSQCPRTQARDAAFSASILAATTRIDAIKSDFDRYTRTPVGNSAPRLDASDNCATLRSLADARRRALRSITTVAMATTS